jgi:hypothetical protein
VQPSELMSFVNLYSSNFEEVVNYQEFLQILARVNDQTAGGGSI